VAEADETADADQKVQAEGEQREDEDLGRHLERVGVADERQQREGGNDEKREDALDGAPRPQGVAEADRMGAAGSLRPAEEPIGADDEDDRHEQEDEHQRDLGEDQDAERLELADDERGEKGSRHAAHAADDGDDKSLGDDVEVHARGRGRLRDLQGAAEPGQKGAEKERAGEEERLVDAERADHVAVLRRGAHENTEARAPQDQPEDTEHHRASGDQDELIGREAMAEDFHGRAQAGRARA
jgi:hypothetical protein